MQPSEHAVTLSAEQIAQLGTALAQLRHNVNNHLALIVAAAELLRRKPELAARFTESFFEPPQKISQEVKAFSDELERLLGIRREPPRE